MPVSLRYTRAIEAIDAYHRQDPNTETVGGEVYHSELLYAKRMTAKLEEFAPGAAEAVQLAARCQHIGRWEIPRNQYPKDRKGYLQWRNEEKIHHARIAGKILADCGYEPDLIDKVKFLLLKKELHSNADTQLLEDVACMVFVEYYLADFSARHDDEKVVDILRKTLKKMSPEAKSAVGRMDLPLTVRSLIGRSMSAS
jgi:hypothetical protein